MKKFMSPEMDLSCFSEEEEDALKESEKDVQKDVKKEVQK